MTTSEAYALLRKIAEAGDCTVRFGRDENGPTMDVAWRPDLPEVRRDKLIEIAALAAHEHVKIEARKEEEARAVQGKLPLSEILKRRFSK